MAHLKRLQQVGLPEGCGLMRKVSCLSCPGGLPPLNWCLLVPGGEHWKLLCPLAEKAAAYLLPEVLVHCRAGVMWAWCAP